MASSPSRCAVLLLTFVVSVTLTALAGGAGHAAAAGNPCQIKKLRVAGKEARQRLLCEKRDLATGADPICIGAAQERRALAFQRVEARGGCITDEDSADIGNEVIALGIATLDALRPVHRPRRAVQNGQCNGIPDFTTGLSPEEVQMCGIAIAVSETAARECD